MTPSVTQPNCEASPHHEVTVLNRIDGIKRERGIPLHQKMTASQLIDKYAAAIHIIHQAGRPQSDVYIYLESQEGKLEHADDTLRKAINKIIRGWRNRTKPTTPAPATKSPAPFADKFNTGGVQW